MPRFILLPTTLEARLQHAIDRGDAAAVRALLQDALDPVVADLLAPTPTPIPPAEVDRLLAKLTTTFAEQGSVPPLSDEATSRASFYEDRW